LEGFFFFFFCQAGWLVPEGYLSDSEGVEEDDGHDRMMGKSRSHNSSKRLIIRKIVLGPFFEGETEDEALRPFETHFFNGNFIIS
jgi:hypothetical protein